MSAWLHDLKTNLLEGLGIPPQNVVASQATPTGVDMIQGDGLCNIAVNLGVIDNASSGTVAVQESDDNSTNWTAVTLTTNGTSIAFTGTDDNTIKRDTFQRSKRYVRTPVTIAGGGPSALMGVIVSEQLKTVY